MRVFWWQDGVYIEPGSKVNREVLYAITHELEINIAYFGDEDTTGVVDKVSDQVSIVVLRKRSRRRCGNWACFSADITTTHWEIRTLSTYNDSNML